MNPQHFLNKCLKESHQPAKLHDLAVLTNPILVDDSRPLHKDEICFMDLPLVCCSKIGHIAIWGKVSSYWKEDVPSCTEKLTCTIEAFDPSPSFTVHTGGFKLVSVSPEQVLSLFERYCDSIDFDRIKSTFPLSPMTGGNIICYSTRWLINDVDTEFTMHRTESSDDLKIWNEGYQMAKSHVVACQVRPLVRPSSHEGTMVRHLHGNRVSSKMIRWMKRHNSSFSIRFLKTTGFAMLSHPAPLDGEIEGLFEGGDLKLTDLLIGCVVKVNGNIEICGTLSQLLQDAEVERLNTADLRVPLQQQPLVLPGKLPMKLTGAARKIQLDAATLTPLLLANKDAFNWESVNHDKERRYGIMTGAYLLEKGSSFEFASEGNSFSQATMQAHHFKMDRTKSATTGWSASENRCVIAAEFLEVDAKYWH